MFSSVQDFLLLKLNLTFSDVENSKILLKLKMNANLALLLLMEPVKMVFLLSPTLMELEAYVLVIFLLQTTN